VTEGGPWPFPIELAESSGVTWSLRHPGVIWTVPDGRIDAVWAVDDQGEVLGSVPVELPGVWDVEDLSSAPCAEGTCLFLADIGDNALTRDSIVVWRIPEPELPRGEGDGGSAREAMPAEPWVLRYPGPEHDAEASFLDRAGRIHLVSKGAEKPAGHFVGPVVSAGSGDARLERVQTVEERVRPLGDMITGASAVPGSDLVVLRTYRDLLVYRLDGDDLVPVEGGVQSLLTLREPQGEAIAVGTDRRIAVTSEAGPLGRVGGMHLLRCGVIGG
jgi:hypothetical protein